MSERSHIKTTQEARVSVILAPGFLTEPLTKRLLSNRKEISGEVSKGDSELPLEALDAFDPTKALDARAWRHEFSKMVDLDRCDVSCFDWASQSLVELIAQSAQLIYSHRATLSLQMMDTLHAVGMKLYQTWREAIDQADSSVEPLYGMVAARAEEAPHQPIYVVGHSLGARIALRLAERLSERPVHAPVKISAWAPAIDQDELAWSTLRELSDPPEVFYTQGDLVLKYLYKLGQSSLTGVKAIDMISLPISLASKGRAVGLIGAGEMYPEGLQIDLGDTAIGHLTYLSEMPTVIGRSVYLNSIKR